MSDHFVRRGLRASVLLVMIVAACADEATAPLADEARLMGVLQLEDYRGAISQEGPTQSVGSTVRWSESTADVLSPPVVIDAPATVDAGAPFDATVYTIGQSGCWSADGLDVRVSGRLVAITPFDTYSGAEICTLILHYLPHRTTLQLVEPGEWTIRVEGRRTRHGDPSWMVPVSAETTVTVR